ncbi:TolC family protein [Paraburkholderia bannensis]|uniref:TolC family protein n=1 Tax=Paraburkholderia bannensis TaxID=765414 RepID=UPI002AB6FF5E|nr:TolC family protein [Paraburkholderia bannensis]
MRNIDRFLKIAVLTPVSAALMACTVGPDFVKPEAQHGQAWTAHNTAAAVSHVTDKDFDLQWWSIFDDPMLSQLIARATASNLDVRIAANRLEQSRLARRIVSSAYMPSVGANATAQRMGSSADGIMSLLGVTKPTPASSVADGTGYGNTGISGSDGSAPFNLFQYGFDATWELDIWGKTRRSVEAADAMTAATDEERHAVVLDVRAETATDYVALRTTQASLDTTRHTLDLANKALDLTKKRREAGAATSLEQAEADAQVQSIASRIPELESRRDKLINALSLLVAEPPGALGSELDATKPIPPVPAEVPVGVPSELAHRRPDIREAEDKLHAATADIGVAKADFYPQLTLSGSFGMQSLSFPNLGSWAARQFGVGPTLSLPIFQGGRLVGTLHLRKAQQQEAALQYQKTVLNAWHEVDDALIEYDAEQRRRTNLAASVEQNRTAYDAALARYKAGAATFLDVLVVQQAYLDAETQYVNSDGNVSLTAIRLYKALGGGWESSTNSQVADATHNQDKGQSSKE